MLLKMRTDDLKIYAMGDQTFSFYTPKMFPLTMASIGEHINTLAMPAFTFWSDQCQKCVRAINNITDVPPVVKSWQC